MAKIIKKGKKLRERPLRWECSNCGSTIESVKSEGRWMHDPREGDAVVTQCPACREDNWIDASLFPN
jgi:predicted RNA-binding Zn-ribbon protein involved in translation (DUF1610 family)